MVLTVHQPAYLPWLGFFHKMAIADVFVLFDDVQFERRSFINRNKIKTPNGAIWLTIPLEIKGNYYSKINEMSISRNEESWAKKHLKNIYANYKKSDYFHEHIDFFEEFYKLDSYNLSEILKYQFDYFLKVLNINTKIFLLSELDITGRKQDLILNICKYFHVEKFVFGKLGKNYADEDYFKENGVDIYFQDYVHPTYKQLWGDFIPYLSVIDLLFNEGKEKAMDIIMKDNVLSV